MKKRAKKENIKCILCVNIYMYIGMYKSSMNNCQVGREINT